MGAQALWGEDQPRVCKQERWEAPVGWMPVRGAHGSPGGRQHSRSGRGADGAR